jgi:hypothetical protein
MGFKEQSLIETFEKSQIVRVEFLTLKPFDDHTDFRVNTAHGPTLKSERQNPKANVDDSMVRLTLKPASY